MKLFTKEQAIFTAGLTLAASWVAGNFFFFVGYYSVLKGLKPLKAIMQSFSQWRFGALWDGLTHAGVGEEIRTLAIFALLCGAAASLLLPVALLVALNSKAKSKIYGDAKFATLVDVRRSKSVTWGVDGGKGIVIGKFKGKLLRYVNPDFVSISAGTRAGKGAAIVVPNLLEWIGSMLVLDLKQECFNITSKFRQLVLGNKIFLVNPFSDKTHGFNALYYIDLDTNEGSVDLMGVAEIFYPTDSTSGAEKHFNESAQSLLIALVKALFVFIGYDKNTLRNSNVPDVFSIGSAVDLFHRMELESVVTALKNIHATIGDPVTKGVILDAVDKFSTFITLGDEAKGSVIGTFEKQMKLFSLPQFRAATDRNDFDFRNMRREKMTIYLGILPKEVKIAGTFLNLFFTTAIKIQLSENPDFDPSLKHNVLMLADEFPAFGAVNYVKDSAGYIAGYKVQLLTISQSISQHQENYGEKGAESLMYNHPCKIVYATSDMKNAEYYANEIGYITGTSHSKNKSNSKGAVSRGDAESETRSHLILPQDIKTLADSEEIILLRGENSIRCDKAYYFNDRYFMDKLISLSPRLQEIQKKIGKSKFPSKEQLAEALTKGELEADVFQKGII
jgi:type IV secretion system protein VirD4